jgi:hypothetical protein
MVDSARWLLDNTRWLLDSTRWLLDNARWMLDYASCKCAYGEKIYISLFVLQKCGAGDVLQQQFYLCLCCHLVLYQFASRQNSKI